MKNILKTDHTHTHKTLREMEQVTLFVKGFYSEKSQESIWRLTSVLRSMLNQHFVLTNFSDHEVLLECNFNYKGFSNVYFFFPGKKNNFF